ncbi:hypothetical protein DCAR_0310366 [Daucus carota subsp. sativus]|uniref:Uncharacterized protein n=1 Tax=Daucus carota subsp. sativus TaxID=79200 RepID=A0A165ZTP6_DAUCS|nr:PREDICTED: uncharacterized protein LOC108210677 [Daucus carota subsp. sativus]WOG91118.1 hypothetical protein DCAR_0310366 [Daucus carota subsp. sativus]
MPQVDLEALVAVCRVGSSGRKIACEPLDETDHNHVEKLPDSILLSRNAEFDWLDRNAVLERKDSAKRNAAIRNNSKSSSQRFAKKPKAVIIGLPKTQKNNQFDMRRSKVTNVRLFPPKRSESIEKARAQMKEPSSPKVSCVGRVRSKRSRRRRPEAEEKAKQGKKKGFCANLLALFGLNRGDRSVIKADGLSGTCKKKARENKESVGRNEVVMAPGLGGMARFSSGRRSYEMDQGDGARLSGDSGRSMELKRCGSTRRN